MTDDAPCTPDRWLTRLGWFLTLSALAVLAVAYIAVAWEHGTPMLWNVVVHEDGHRTFAQTLFYFDHVTRELPGDLMLGVAIGAGGALALGNHHTTARTTPLWAVALLFVLCVWPVIETVRTLGLEELRLNLLQYPTREGEAPVWGAHWRYHLLERGPMMLLAIGLFQLIASFRFEKPARRALNTALAVIALYLALTIIFTTSLYALAQPFTDTRFLGHQIREIFTHGSVTLPLGIGILLLLPRQPVALGNRSNGSVGRAVAAIILPLACFAFVLFAALAADAGSAGQSDSMITLLAPHFFEHGLGYPIVILSAIVVFEKLR